MAATALNSIHTNNGSTKQVSVVHTEVSKIYVKEQPFDMQCIEY